MYALCTETYLDPHTKEYLEIFTIEPKPKGPLLSILKRMPYQKLSPYKLNDKCGCFYAVKNINPDAGCHTEFLPVEDLPVLFHYMTLHGYEIDTKLTKMLFAGKSAAKKRGLVCYIRFPEGKTD